MFTEQERRIFRATVDGADRAFDPLAVRRRLAGAQRSEGLDLWGLLESHEAIADAEKAGPLPGSLRDEQYALVERLARLGCLAFDVPALQHDGAGWTQQEAAGALSAYLVWEAGLKGESPASPSPSTSTAGPPVDSATAGPGPSTTAASSA